MEKEKEAREATKPVKMGKEVEVSPDEVFAYEGQGFRQTLVRMYREVEVQHGDIDAHEKDGYQVVGGGETGEEHNDKKKAEHKPGPGSTPTRR